MHHAYRRYVAVWLGLLGLLALTFASSYLDMGIWNSVVNLGIAAVKVALVAVFFMHAAGSGALIRIVSIAALLMLGLLFLISGADYATRDTHGAPWQVPQQIAPAGRPGL